MPGRLQAHHVRWIISAVFLLLACGPSQSDRGHWSERPLVRAEGNPLIRPGMPGLAGSAGANINGLCVIRVPDWVQNRLARYYLYFAHHQGRYIRLALADDPAGP